MHNRDTSFSCLKWLCYDRIHTRIHTRIHIASNWLPEPLIYTFVRCPLFVRYLSVRCPFWNGQTTVLLWFCFGVVTKVVGKDVFSLTAIHIEDVTKCLKYFSGLIFSFTARAISSACVSRSCKSGLSNFMSWMNSRYSRNESPCMSYVTHLRLRSASALRICKSDEPVMTVCRSGYES